MLSFLPPFLRGCLSALLLGINTLLLCLPLMFFSLSRFLIPVKAWHRLSTRICIAIAECWISINSGWMKLTRPMDWQVNGLEGLKKDGWYLVTCNHQSWADIFIVQHLMKPSHPHAEVFPQTGIDLGADHRPVLVGAGFPFHEALLQGLPGQASRETGRRSQGNPQSL